MLFLLNIVTLSQKNGAYHAIQPHRQHIKNLFMLNLSGLDVLYTALIHLLLF